MKEQEEIFNESISSYEKILQTKKTKYVFLKNNLKYIPPREEIKEQTINVFIDLYSMFNQLFNPETIFLYSNMARKDKNILAAEVINIVGHYRNFFAKYVGLYTNFYLYYSSEKTLSKLDIDKSYKEEWYDKRLNFDNNVFGNFSKLFLKNLSLAKMISEYIPHVYVIDCKKVDHNLLPYLVINEFSYQEHTNIILTNDICQYGFVNHNQNNYILSIKSDKSKILEDEDIFLITTKSKSKTALESDKLFLFRRFFDFIISLGGEKKYNVKAVEGFSYLKALKIFHSLFRENKIVITNNSYTIETISEILIKNNYLDQNLKESFEKNYKLLVPYYNVSISKKSDIILILNQIIDKVNTKSLKELNQELFYLHPINLDFVFIGEQQ